MGSVCCVAARDRTVSNRISVESTSRDIRYSPSWSFRWDSQTHMEDRIDSDSRFSIGNYRNIGLERKRRLEGETESSPGRASPLENMRTSTKFLAGASGYSTVPTFSIEEEDSMTPSNPSVHVPTPSSTANLSKAGPSNSQSLPSDFNPSRRACRSPGWQLARQASDKQVSTLRSPNGASVSEGRHSFMLSVGSSDFRNGGSFGGSSDGWSMRTFSELVASQRERWSFDSENTSSTHGKVTRSNSHLFTSPPAELQACGICSKLTNEYSIVGVLVCGHVYHAECLESITPDTNKFDPPCPVCTVGEKPAFKVAVKLGKAEIEWRTRNKISRIGVADEGILNTRVLSFDGKKVRGKGGPKLGSSSSMKSSLGKPFLRRHFSMGGLKSGRSASDEESTNGRKKGFWSRYRKD